MHAVQGDLNRCIRFAAAIDHQWSALLRRIQNVVAGNRTHCNRRWQSINRQGEIGGRRISGRIADVHHRSGIALWQRLQGISRNVDAPVAVAINRTIVGDAINDDVDRLTIAGHAGGAGQGLRTARLLTIEGAIHKRQIGGDYRQIGNRHGQPGSAGHRVARRIGTAHGELQRAVRQALQGCRRNRDAPAAIRRHGGWIGNAIQHHG